MFSLGEWLLLLLPLGVASVPADTAPCSNPLAPKIPAPPLPTLPPQFSAVVEAKIVNKNKTVEVTEHYDFVNNRGSIRTERSHGPSILLYNFEKFESYFIANGTCRTTNIRQGRYNFINFSTTSQGGGHIGPMADLFKFGSAYNETYLGNETVRGIPVNHWTSCIHWAALNTEFTLDYYFSLPDYPLAGNDQPVPVRTVLKGRGADLTLNNNSSHTFYHIYDFVAFKPGPIEDESVFEVPRGSSCTHSFTIKKRPPTLPDRFSVNVEIISTSHHTRQNWRNVFDFPANLSRMDYTPGPESSEKMKPFRGLPITLIHDFNTGHQYVMEQSVGGDGKCYQVDAMATHGVDVTTTNPAGGDVDWVAMKHGRELFDLDQVQFFYQGQRVVRDLPVDVWGGVRMKWPDTSSNTSIELYYLQRSWHTNGAGMLTGVWMQQQDANKTVVLERMSHFYNLNASAPNLDEFSVRSCYEDKKEDIRYLVFIVPDILKLIEEGHGHAIKVAVRKAVMETTGLEPIRISDIYLEPPVSGTDVYVWFSLLERPSVAGSVENPVRSITLDEAYRALFVAVDSGTFTINIIMDTPGVKTSRVVKQFSLEEASTLVDHGPAWASKNGHSSGSMAALGIVMLILGVVGGLGISYVLWRKRIDIPYLVQH